MIHSSILSNQGINHDLEKTPRFMVIFGAQYYGILVPKKGVRYSNRPSFCKHRNINNIYSSVLIINKCKLEESASQRLKGIPAPLFSYRIFTMAAWFAQLPTFQQQKLSNVNNASTCLVFCNSRNDSIPFFSLIDCCSLVAVHFRRTTSQYCQDGFFYCQWKMGTTNCYQ